MKRIAWKRGMRLTDDILRTSDDNMAEMLSKAFVLASVGRFGLLPSSKPFEISLNIGDNTLSVESLSCLAVTKNGMLIDVHYDTRYSNNFDTRLSIPDISGIDEYILTINVQEGQWQEVSDELEEPIYSFSLFPPDVRVPDNAMPVARIVFDRRGWYMDESNFVPPCLFVASHSKYSELLHRFVDVLAILDEKSQLSINSVAHNMIAVFLPLIQQLRITANKEQELLTPMMLLANVQKCVSAFTCACNLDETIELSSDDEKKFKAFIQAPCNYKDAYTRIDTGIGLCSSIVEKMKMIAESTHVQTPSPRQTERPQGIVAPKLSDDTLFQVCNTSETTIPVLYNNTSATIFFTTDGNTPSPSSAKAAKTRDGFKIKFDNGFRRENGKEKSKSIVVKLLAVANGMNSNIATYTITLKKDLKFRNAIPI